jgi:hypothetical protein
VIGWLALTAAFAAKGDGIMESKELRAEVVAKFDAKAIEFGQLRSTVEAFCVGILIDCKDIIDEIPDAKTLVNVIIDELDDRTNTGALDLIDGQLVKGLFEKFGDTPALENWFYAMRTKALNIINSNVQKA